MALEKVKTTELILGIKSEIIKESVSMAAHVDAAATADGWKAQYCFLVQTRGGFLNKTFLPRCLVKIGYCATIFFSS